MIKTKENLALLMFSAGAIKFGAFRLKLHEKNPDAPLSPIYVDLRVLRSSPDAMEAATKVYLDLAWGLRFDAVADIPTAGTPFTTLISYALKVPMITPRTDQKEHGAGSKIDGVPMSGWVVLLVDDLITKADSKLEAIKILGQAGLTVRDVAVLVDREQGGIKALADLGYTCHAAFKLRELLDLYVQSGRVSREAYGRAVAYLQAP